MNAKYHSCIVLIVCLFSMASLHSADQAAEGFGDFLESHKKSYLCEFDKKYDLSIFMEDGPYTKITADKKIVKGVYKVDANVHLLGNFSLSTPFELECLNLVIEGSVKAPSIKIRARNIFAANKNGERYFKLPLIPEVPVKVRDLDFFDLNVPLSSFFPHILEALENEPGSLICNILDIKATASIFRISNAFVGCESVSVYAANDLHSETKVIFNLQAWRGGLEDSTHVQSTTAGPICFVLGGGPIMLKAGRDINRTGDRVQNNAILEKINFD